MAKKAHLDETAKDDIVTAYTQGAVVDHILAQFEITPLALYKVLREREIPQRKEIRAHLATKEAVPAYDEPHLVTQAVDLEAFLVDQVLVRGRKTKEVAAELNVSPRKVRQVLRRAIAVQFAKLSDAQLHALRNNVLVDFRETHLTIPQIIAKHGITASQLYHMLESNTAQEFRQTLAAQRITSNVDYVAVVEEVLSRLQNILKT